MRSRGELPGNFLKSAGQVVSAEIRWNNSEGTEVRGDATHPKFWDTPGTR